MGTTERRARQKANLRQQILDAARALFIEEGYDAVTMRKVARRIEYSPTAIYLHFKGKQALLAAVCDEPFDRLTRRLDALRTREGDPLELLRQGLHVYVHFGLTHPSHYTVALLVKARNAPPFEGSAGARAFSCLRDAVAGAMEAGRLRRSDVETTAQALWAACHGLVSLLITLDRKSFPFVRRQALIKHTIDTMLAGLT